MKTYIYDLETYPNCFLFCGKFAGDNKHQLWEISNRVNERQNILDFMSYLQNLGATMIGFNNLGFDYPIMHELIMNPYTFTAEKASSLAQNIINAQKFKMKIPRIRFSDRVVPQIDLMKVCHFDNMSKTTNLKALQFAMRSESLEDLPFDIRNLTSEEMDQLRTYNIHDVDETEKFYFKCENLIEIRQDFIDNGTIRGDVLNYSDVKIGVEYLTKMIGRQNCFHGSKPKQTFRESVIANEIILDKINFRTKMFQDIETAFREKIIYPGKKDGGFKIKADLAGLPFDFGIGGVHASVKNKSYVSTDTHQIIDIDVAGMYVAVAIANGFAPEHLGQKFVESYRQIQSDRKGYAKGTSMNALLKLAGNGVYGNSNNVYSCFYDPKYTFSVTINGQLQLLQLVELISLIPGIEFIQANTDGITCVVPNNIRYLFNFWCDEWEKMTGLVLEEVLYSRMWIRDVNNYMAETQDGKIKKKGDYWYPANEKEYEGWWNKDFSNMVRQIAIEKVLTKNWSTEMAVRLVTNPFDFMLRYKATGKSSLFIGGVKQLKTVRYYVSKSGQPMKKIAPPKGPIGTWKRKNKVKDSDWERILSEIPEGAWDERIHTKNESTYQIVTTSVKSGWKVRACNKASDFNWDDVDWDFYIEEVEKLVIGSK